ncbi:branched-chain amino acid transport system ATP-binding protein [Rhizobium petrolearium]|uniref:ABC transporter ATP-binding protein n=2 Tax=Neorhizobium TaxID=1525371 RepID=A0ABV0MF44_9HYPH|nr:ABC transporter ATP-binding protein [Neorhizobium petrolearium]MBP1848416.1 branched-chain amino acid transport system ATP-binding protein [Neorhizobium petrolearium]MCC2614475.1 ABC transporter ATP-binding protein [Neorhizobium petrolearium]WGI72238.1 ABC transporter ATP-binding protein [Neorhizobium petrolearium]
MSDTYMLEATGLTRRYGGFAALNNVSFKLRQGEIRGLIGSNGAGKSTCMDVLTGRGRNQQGTVCLNGQDISRLSERERRAVGLSRSFQKTNIFPELGIRQQVQLAARKAEFDNTEEVLAELSLTAIADRTASDVSYGDQRRVDLALALVGKPKLLLLDEPAAGLTIEESLAMARHLRNLAERWKLTILLVEHDMEVIFAICDRLTVLHLGEVLTEGLPDEVRANPEVIRAYLGSTFA